MKVKQINTCPKCNRIENYTIKTSNFCDDNVDLLQLHLQCHSCQNQWHEFYKIEMIAYSTIED